MPEHSDLFGLPGREHRDIVISKIKHFVGKEEIS